MGRTFVRPFFLGRDHASRRVPLKAPCWLNHPLAHGFCRRR
jgi:hypothetical protein